MNTIKQVMNHIISLFNCINIPTNKTNDDQDTNKKELYEEYNSIMEKINSDIKSGDNQNIKRKTIDKLLLRNQ